MTITPRIVLPLLLVIFAAMGASLLAQENAGKARAQQFKIPKTDEGLPGAGPIRRYEWFQNLWTRRRSQWARQVQEDQKSIVFLGDSITQGWGNKMADSFIGAKVANRGISGDTSRGMLIRLREDVLSLNPACVVMLMGTNDLEEKAEPATIASDVKL
ncbi:MAG: GDSL-type esterase/lipase family protein, partial [Pirellulaceae bacterium]|nr:GDSL-type esterase/lipase family protein [Pirellulaceae bacterium]